MCGSTTGKDSFRNHRRLLRRGDVAAATLSDANDFALRLPNTTAGNAWLGQFDATDQEIATRLLGALTLVSHWAFERSLQSLILAEAGQIDGPVALYAARELYSDTSYSRGW